MSSFISSLVANQGLFEKSYTAYNVVQAGLAYLQKYPELTSLTLKIQKVFTIVDLLGLAATSVILYQKQTKKFEKSHPKAFKVAAALSIAALGALSYGFVRGLNAYLTPTQTLKDALVRFDPTILKGINVDFASPLSHQLMQSLYVCRIVTSFALSFFSQNQMLGMTSAFSQAFSLFRISQLKWINVVQNLEYPLQVIKAAGGKIAVDPKYFKQMISRFSFMVHNSCTQNSTHLHSTLKSIFNYVSLKRFENSFWDDWHSTSRFVNFGYSRHLVTTTWARTSFKYFRALVVRNPLEPCDCTLSPELVSAQMHFVRPSGIVIPILLDYI